MGEDEIRESILALIKVIDKGISMERHAVDFYSSAAERTRSPEGRKMFAWLAQFESGHLDRLRKKREELLSHESVGSMPHPPEEDHDLSEASEEARLPENPTDIDVLKAAIANERRAYSYYERRLTHASDDSVRAMLKGMAQDEAKHIEILTDQLRSLQTDRLWITFEEIERSLKPHSE